VRLHFVERLSYDHVLCTKEIRFVDKSLVEYHDEYKDDRSFMIITSKLTDHLLSTTHEYDK
jgi:hypothetical protein